MKAYEYRHVVSFEETNLLGNVYYTNHLIWQGRCREMFLREHAPDVLDELASGLYLVTTHCACDYFADLHAFDEVVLAMTLAEKTAFRLVMRFDYQRVKDGAGELVARGEQHIVCMRKDGERMVSSAFPASMDRALKPFAPR